MKDKNHLLSPVVDIISLIALIGVTAISGILVLRTWEIFVSLIGRRFSITLIVLCVVLILCFVYITATNLVCALAIKNETICTETNNGEKKEKEKT